MLSFQLVMCTILDMRKPAIDCVAQECTGAGYERLRMIDLFAGAGGLSEGLQ